MENILEIKQLNKTYQLAKNNQQEVLKNVNLEVKQGEFITIMGPSGSGKSTLLYNISGMDKMTSGSVVLHNQELSAMNENKLAQLRLDKMGFIFQQSNLLKNLNILDNIILPGYQAQKEERKTINERAQSLMRQIGISELSNNDISQASGGQLQRVAICRALINKPEIIFGDEPTGALNSRATEEVMNTLAQINEDNTTIVLVSHDPKVAAKSERVIFMIDGEIISEHYLGKYLDSATLKAREVQLNAWLNELNF